MENLQIAACGNVDTSLARRGLLKDHTASFTHHRGILPAGTIIIEVEMDA